MTHKILRPEWPAPKNVRACTTLRGCEPDFFNTLPSKPKQLKQTHSSIVVCADQLQDHIPEADASFAFKSGTVCMVRTADCLPILICDKQGTQVVAIHAGWRGLAAGIITNSCKQLTTSPDQCLVWLGPAIGARSFEVGKDVLDHYLSLGWDPNIVQQAFEPSHDTRDKWFGNLNLLARHNLQECGINADNIYGGELCSYSDPERFYSYRRSQDVDRMYTLIWLK